jgi:hypothetical protein
MNWIWLPSSTIDEEQLRFYQLNFHYKTNHPQAEKQGSGKDLIKKKL